MSPDEFVAYRVSSEEAFSPLPQTHIKTTVYSTVYHLPYYIMKLDLSGLYKYLKSEECSLFFQNVLPENKTEIIETILGNEVFLTTANQFVPDVAIIREQLGNFLSGILKKKTAVPVPLPVVEIKPDPIVFILEEEEEEEEEEEDTSSKGTHIGNGIYLLREEHRIKMTTPDFVVYY